MGDVVEKAVGLSDGKRCLVYQEKYDWNEAAFREVDIPEFD